MIVRPPYRLWLLHCLDCDYLRVMRHCILIFC